MPQGHAAVLVVDMVMAEMPSVMIPSLQVGALVGQTRKLAFWRYNLPEMSDDVVTADEVHRRISASIAAAPAELSRAPHGEQITLDTKMYMQNALQAYSHFVITRSKIQSAVAEEEEEEEEEEEAQEEEAPVEVAPAATVLDPGTANLPTGMFQLTPEFLVDAALVDIALLVQRIRGLSPPALREFLQVLWPQSLPHTLEPTSLAIRLRQGA
jgi:hypothetical protein